MSWKEEFITCFENSTIDDSLFDKALAIKAENMPKLLYQYQPNLENRRQGLANNRIWLGSPEHFNDPYDCLFTFNDSLVQAAAHERLAKKFNGVDEKMLAAALSKSSSLVSGALSTIRGWREELCKVSCFSENPRSLLMWGHYADNHRGFCVEYDLQRADAEQMRKKMYPVIYSDKPYDLTPWGISLVNGSTIFNPQWPTLALIFKFKDWEYEREWRALEVSQAKIDDHGWTVPAPVRVFLRSKMATADKQQFRAICDPVGVEVLEMHRAEGSFELFEAPLDNN